PTCYMPRDIYITNKTSTSFTLNWSPIPGQSVVDYEWEVRTSGEPGSGSTGLIDSGTVTGTTVDIPENIAALNAGTNYKVYIRSVCCSSDSIISLALDLNTICSASNFTVTSPVNFCGVQDVELTLTVVYACVAFWYYEKDSLVEQGSNS